MFESFRTLGKAVISKWLQSLSGTLMAVIALVAGVKEWTVKPWIWLLASAGLFAWAVVRAYHELRMECDAALDGLVDKTNHQTLADELTERHRWATHELLNRIVLNGTAAPKEWVQGTHEWYMSVNEIMRRHDCSPQDFNHVDTINQLDLNRVSIQWEISMFIVRLQRVGELSTRHAELARDATSRTVSR